MTAQITYRSLYAITERRPEYRSLSLLADFGVPAGPIVPAQVRPTCSITLMAGPDAEDPSTTDGIRPRWWL
ncbi:MAG: hypothetical protein RIE53_10600 [Rhodothermales bacterium]